MSKSCLGCKFLYAHDSGYSNWTVESTDIKCALDKNPHLPADEPYDWNQKVEADNWAATQASRCERYAPGDFVRLDVDGERGPADETNDAEAIAAIVAHSGVPERGH